MRNHVRNTISRNNRRLVLFPAPLQGHISPMLQLASILYASGFEITLIHTTFNTPNYSNYPCFTFKSIPDGLLEVMGSNHVDARLCMGHLIRSCVGPFKDCLVELVKESGDGETIACVITDALWYFTQAIADELKLPRMVLRTSSLASFIVYTDIPRLHQNGRFNKQVGASSYLWLIMEAYGNASILQSPETRRRIIMFPLPFQGHINPMLQLANILYTQGDFAITIIHTQYNSPDPSNYPYFAFTSIDDRFSEIVDQLGVNPDATYFLKYLNESCVDSFTDCLQGLLVESKEEKVACVITDAGFYFTQGVAGSLNIPRMVLWTSSLGCVPAYEALPFYYKKDSLSLTKQESDYESSVPEYPLLKFKDIAKITTNPQGMGDFVSNMLNQAKASSGLIWNTFKELEESELETISRDFQVPSFILGPFHKYFPAYSSSLIEQDRTILSWLDTQSPKSTIYISFGSGAYITELEFQEVAHGLLNIGLPFLWVVRPGMVHGSEWLELLPEKFLERVGDRGRIVKWCPQQEVLAHQATGCFWTHNGWNSTLESICEGVPMICSPSFVDQPINARYVSDVWKIGVFLEDGFERVGIELAIKSVMMGKEGEEIRDRISYLKETLNLSLGEGGSSHQSLRSLVDYISSL